MIINIRGTNGSGKSTVVRELLRLQRARPCYGLLGPRQPEGYELSNGWFVVGPYTVPTWCGAEPIMRRCGVEALLSLADGRVARGHVLVEGMTLNGYGKFGAWLEEAGAAATVCFMGTPIDVCVGRIEGRRTQAGNDMPFDPKHVHAKFREVQRARQRFLDGGKVRVVDLSDDPVTDVLCLMGEAR